MEINKNSINLTNYTQEQMFEYVKTFGYSFNEMCTWIDEGYNLDIIRDCIFEIKNIKPL